MYDSFKKLALSFVPDINEKELKAIEKKFKPLSLKKGDYFLKAGQFANEIAFIYKGILRTYVTLEDGVTEATNNFAFENMICSSAASLIEKSPSFESIQAVEATQLLVISSEDLEYLYQKYHRCERLGRIFVEQLLVEQDYRLRWFIEKNAQQRYESFLAHFANYHQRIPKYLVASYLGITPESLSRLRQQYKKQEQTSVKIESV